METPIAYETHWGKNETLADQYWDDINTSPVVVALSKDWARKHGLEQSVPFPWDDEKGLYHVKVFHQIHCLKVMRKIFKDFETGQTVKPLLMKHVYHCINTIRQDLMCYADDTPMPSIDAPHMIGNNQIMQCRNWDQLIAWTQHPDRNACFNIISDYKTVSHRLEQYAFCPKDSPYYSVMNAYFERHGHKPLFDDEAFSASAVRVI